MKCVRKLLRGFNTLNPRKTSQIATVLPALSRAFFWSCLGVSLLSPLATLASTPSSPTAIKGAEIEAKIKLAKTQESKHDWAGVIETLQGPMSSLPRPGLLILAKAYEMKADNLNEMRVLDLCLAKNATDYYCKTGQAQVLVRMKHFDDAIAAFTAAKEMNPKFEPAYLGLIKQLESTGDSYEARNILADMKKIFGDKPSYHTDLCRLYSKDAFLEKTVEACNEAISADSGNPLNYIYLATSLSEKEEPKKALTLLQKGRKKFRKSEPILTALGGLELDQKKFTDAYHDFKAAVASNSKSMDAWTGLGSAALELQKFEESLAAFDKACSIDRHAVKAFRTASSKLRLLKESIWQTKFEDHINMCNPQY